MAFICLLAAVRAADPAPTDERRLLQLGPGDSVTVQVYGQPDMTTTAYVGDDGTISVPLCGAVKVAGLSPVEASSQVAAALKSGQFLIDPQVTITVLQSHSQLVSVLGEVNKPGRYPIDPNTTVVDLLAQAGGVTELGSEVIYILRDDVNGSVNRFPVNLKGFTDRRSAPPTEVLKSGDSIFVPRADQYYIYGEVANPNMYRIEPGMTVIQAIARAGGVTPRGSERRVDVRRVGKDGQNVILHSRPNDTVQTGDVIRVKESIF